LKKLVKFRMFGSSISKICIVFETKGVQHVLVLVHLNHARALHMDKGTEMAG
jgi:hypothetical protein